MATNKKRKKAVEKHKKAKQHALEMKKRLPIVRRKAAIAEAAKFQKHIEELAAHHKNVSKEAQALDIYEQLTEEE